MQTENLTTAQEAPAPEIEAVKPARADPRD